MTKAGTRRTRITVDLEPDLYEWIATQRVQDRIKTTERVRALIALAREDAELQSRIPRKVREMEPPVNA